MGNPTPSTPKTPQDTVGPHRVGKFPYNDGSHAEPVIRNNTNTTVTNPCPMSERTSVTPYPTENTWGSSHELKSRMLTHVETCIHDVLALEALAPSLLAPLIKKSV